MLAGHARRHLLVLATGYSLIGGVWQPKAIVELIQFNGDGTLSVPAATVANRAGDGAVAQSPPGTGIYTLGEDCKGTLQFMPGPSFDILPARKVWRSLSSRPIQTMSFRGALRGYCDNHSFDFAHRSELALASTRCPQRRGRRSNGPERVNDCATGSRAYRSD